MEFCTNCGAKLEKGMKFCTNCGMKVADMVAGESETPAQTVETVTPEMPTEANVEETENVKDSVQEQPVQAAQPKVNQTNSQTNSTTTATTNSNNANENLENTKQFVGSYWTWLKDSFKKPSQVEPTDSKYFGLTTLIILMLINLANFIIPIKQINSYIGVTGSDAVLSNLYIPVLILFAIVQFGYIFISYLLVNATSTIRINSFLEYLNEFGYRINYTLISSLATTIFLLLGTGVITSSPIRTMVLILTLISNIGFHIALTITIFDQAGQFKLDKTFVVVIVEVIMAAVIALYFSSVILPQIESVIIQLLEKFFESQGSVLKDALSQLLGQ